MARNIDARLKKLEIELPEPQQPKVAKILNAVTAIGVASMPFGVAIEVEARFQVRD